MMLSVSSVVKFREGVIPAIEFASRHGAQHVDIFVASPHFDYLNREEALRVTKELRKRAIGASLKSPGFVENLASMNPEVRRMTLRFFAKLVDLAHLMGATHIVIKPGILFFPERIRREKAMRNIEDGLREVLEMALEKNVTVLLENYYYPIEALRSPRDFDRMLDIIDAYPNSGFALNVPHMLEAGISPLKILRYRGVVARIKQIYVGPRPSPWERNVNEESVEDVLEATRHLLMRISPEYVTCASVSEELVLKLMEAVI